MALGLARRLGDEGERQRQAERHRQQLLGVERDVEHLPRNVEHPEARRRRPAAPGASLVAKTVAFDDSAGELFRAGDEALLRRGGDVLCRAGGWWLVGHALALGRRLRRQPWLSTPSPRSSCPGSISARRDDRSLSCLRYIVSTEKSFIVGAIATMSALFFAMVSMILYDDLVLHLGVGEQDVVHRVDLHRLRRRRHRPGSAAMSLK